MSDIDDTVEIPNNVELRARRVDALTKAQAEVDAYDDGSLEAIAVSELDTRKQAVEHRTAAQHALTRFDLVAEVEDAKRGVARYDDDGTYVIDEFSFAVDKAAADERLAAAEKALTRFDLLRAVEAAQAEVDSYETGGISHGFHGEDLRDARYGLIGAKRALEEFERANGV